MRDDAKKRRMDADKAVPTMESWMQGGRDDKKMNSLSFVIPKVKSEPKPDKVKKKKPPREEPKKVWLPPPTAIAVPRIIKPALPTKALTEEDKGRSVLAKLEDTAGERENLRWQTNDRGKNAVRVAEWQPFNSAEDRRRRLGQEGPHWRNCGPGRDTVNGSTSIPVRFQHWNAGSNTGHPQNPGLNAPRLPPPSRRHGPQQPIHSIVSNDRGLFCLDCISKYTSVFASGDLFIFIRLAGSVDSFKVQLKTSMLAKAYPILLVVRYPCSGMAALLRHINCCNQTKVLSQLLQAMYQKPKIKYI